MPSIRSIGKISVRSKDIYYVILVSLLLLAFANLLYNVTGYTVFEQTMLLSSNYMAYYENKVLQVLINNSVRGEFLFNVSRSNYSNPELLINIKIYNLFIDINEEAKFNINISIIHNNTIYQTIPKLITTYLNSSNTEKHRYSGYPYVEYIGGVPIIIKKTFISNYNYTEIKINIIENNRNNNETILNPTIYKYSDKLEIRCTKDTIIFNYIDRAYGYTCTFHEFEKPTYSVNVNNALDVKERILVVYIRFFRINYDSFHTMYFVSIISFVQFTTFLPILAYVFVDKSAEKIFSIASPFLSISILYLSLIFSYSVIYGINSSSNSFLKLFYIEFTNIMIFVSSFLINSLHRFFYKTIIEKLDIAIAIINVGLLAEYLIMTTAHIGIFEDSHHEVFGLISWPMVPLSYVSIYLLVMLLRNIHILIAYKNSKRLFILK